ncbi:MAG TPA: hypothetical protein VGF39_00880 [Stellaceae bacterium]|jgi:hypothetical protein
MPTAAEKVTAYLEKLEADRRSAIAISKEKAEEAKLIKARQEGFEQAIEILGLNDNSQTQSELRHDQTFKRARRNIPKMILQELSFSGNPMRKDQIAKAIDYLPWQTERALKRLESSGKVVRNADGRWEVAAPPVAQPNGHAATALN